MDSDNKTKDQIKDEIREKVWETLAGFQNDVLEPRLRQTQEDIKDRLKESVDEINATASKLQKFHQGFIVASIVFGTLVAVGLAEFTLAPKGAFPRLFRGFIKTYYPPTEVYEGTKAIADIDHFEGIVRKVRSERLKEWIGAWNIQDYKKVFGKQEFHDVMGDVAKEIYFTNVGTPGKKISANTVMEIGKIVAVPASIVPVGRLSKDATTEKCENKIRDDEYAAIIIISKEAPLHHYLWFGCDEKYPTTTYLGISLGEGEHNLVHNIRLKEVNRTGNFSPGKLEVRITQKLADDYGITGRKSGFVYVNHAE